MLWRRERLPWRHVWGSWWPAILVVVATVLVVLAALWWLGRPLDAGSRDATPGSEPSAVSPSPTASPTG